MSLCNPGDSQAYKYPRRKFSSNCAINSQTQAAMADVHKQNHKTHHSIHLYCFFTPGVWGEGDKKGEKE